MRRPERDLGVVALQAIVRARLTADEADHRAAAAKWSRIRWAVIVGLALLVWQIWDGVS